MLKQPASLTYLNDKQENTQQQKNLFQNYANGIDLNQADKFGKLDEDAQKTILSIIQKNGTIENAEFQSIKKLSEERADEARQYKKQLDSATKEIEDKKHTIELLEQKINDFQSNGNSKEKQPDKDEWLNLQCKQKKKLKEKKQKWKLRLKNSSSSRRKRNNVRLQSPF